MQSSDQPEWVLLSASADHELNNSSSSFLDANLSEARYLNKTNPNSLYQKLPSRFDNHRISKWAIILVGELRCLDKSHDFIQRIAKNHDLFIVTSSKYESECASLSATDRIVISENSAEKEHEDSLPHNAMKQWYKLNLGLEMIKNMEHKTKRLYSNILKIRSDYHFVYPRWMIRNLSKELLKPSTGFLGASDKVFAGRRDNMMTLQGFYENLQSWFYMDEDKYWPINIKQILQSDESIKWYGFNWPSKIVGDIQNTDSWRRLLLSKTEEIQSELNQFKVGDKTNFYQLFKGDRSFASEISFAKYLNFNGIPFKSCRSLRGFLYNNRFK